MKEIKLSQWGKHKGMVAFVDDSDFDFINQWRWHARSYKTSRTFYAVRKDYANCKKTVLMHRVILNPRKDMITDHKDHNGLNNQRSNLRECTRVENSRNCLPTGKYQYMGICHDKVTRPSGKHYDYIVPKISINGSSTRLGVCKTEIQAAKRYDAAARFFYGEFANLNFK